MSNKHHKNAKIARGQKQTKARIAEAVGKKGESANRIFVRKHSELVGFLYNSEIEEINTMIETASKTLKNS